MIGLKLPLPLLAALIVALGLLFARHAQAQDQPPAQDQDQSHRITVVTGLVSPLAMIAMFAPLGFVLVLSLGVNKLSTTAAQALFWAFCATMGASLTNIFLIYTSESIVRVFFITAGTFGAMSLWGYTTKPDLSRFGSFLMMGLIGIIIAGLVNIFLASSALQFAISIIGVVVFTGLTAYDTQRIKADYVQYAYAAGPEMATKRSVYDALSLYLNFINLFMLLLQLLGNRNSN